MQRIHICILGRYNKIQFICTTSLLLQQFVKTTILIERQTRGHANYGFLLSVDSNYQLHRTLKNLKPLELPKTIYISIIPSF